MATLMQIRSSANTEIQPVQTTKSSFSHMSDLFNSEISTLFKIKKTQLKMLRTRGYDISREVHILSWNVNNFSNVYIDFAKSQNMTVRSSLTQIYNENPTFNLPKLCVYYADMSSKTTFGKDDFRNFIEFLDRYEVRNGILITSKPLSPDAKKHKKKLSAYSIQVFLDQEITIDPTEHVQVPKHEICSEQERLSITSRPNFDNKDSIIIQPSDIIVRYLGAKKGQMIKVHRINMINGMVMKYIVYRTVKNIGSDEVEATIDPEEEI
jgi:DNA-directed RNA polymerase subunit H (RpoH/RPB5)